MGNPPKRVVYQKLIRRYFKRSGEIKSEQAATYRTELYKCWERYGIDHPKCEHLVANFDRGWAIEMSNRERFYDQVKLYPAHFNSMVAPQPDKMYFKGRNPEGFWHLNRAFRYPKY